MPRVSITQEDAFRDFIICRMRRMKISQERMARELGMESRQVFAYRLSVMKFSYEELRILIRVLLFSKEDVERWFL